SANMLTAAGLRLPGIGANRPFFYRSATAAECRRRGRRRDGLRRCRSRASATTDTKIGTAAAITPCPLLMCEWLELFCGECWAGSLLFIAQGVVLRNNQTVGCYHVVDDLAGSSFGILTLKPRNCVYGRIACLIRFQLF